MLNQPMNLVWPDAQYMAGYVHALEQGWSRDHFRPETTFDELKQIAEDPERFVARLVDRGCSMRRALACPPRPPR